MKMRELALRLQFDQYCDLKEQESLLGEIKNILSLETARVDFLDREISSMDTENKRLENFVEEASEAKEESKAQTRLAEEQALKIKAEEAEILRNCDALENKINAIGKLEDEMRELQRVLDQLQDEKNELVKKLDTAEKSYASKVLDELEKGKKERADEAKELIYLRWTNACLRHDLTRHHEQQQNQDRNHAELESDEVIHYDSEHELHNSLLENPSVPSSEEHHSAHQYHIDSPCSKRTKLLERLKKWDGSSEKPRMRHLFPEGQRNF
ncbi:hypothetical protein SESBI_15494 [Sesbania bispinosa]|nr:hypothetical protein SESBI_15494 [Sesbania bispinosa]